MAAAARLVRRVIRFRKSRRPRWMHSAPTPWRKQLSTRGDLGWVALTHRAIELDSAFAAPYGLAGLRVLGSPTIRGRRRRTPTPASDWPGRCRSGSGSRCCSTSPTPAKTGPPPSPAPGPWWCRTRPAPSKWLTLAQLYYFDGQFSRAVEAYDSSRRDTLPPVLRTLLMNQATVLARVGRQREAAALYEEGFAAESSLVRHPFVSHEYGVTLVLLGRVADARAAYRRRLDDIPSGRAGGLRSLAMLEAHLGRFALANQLLTDAEAASSASDDTLGTAITYLLRAEVLMARGRRSEALADLAALERTAADACCRTKCSREVSSCWPAWERPRARRRCSAGSNRRLRRFPAAPGRGCCWPGASCCWREEGWRRDGRRWSRRWRSSRPTMRWSRPASRRRPPTRQSRGRRAIRQPGRPTHDRLGWTRGDRAGPLSSRARVGGRGGSSARAGRLPGLPVRVARCRRRSARGGRCAAADSRPGRRPRPKTPSGSGSPSCRSRFPAGPRERFRAPGRSSPHPRDRRRATRSARDSR